MKEFQRVAVASFMLCVVTVSQTAVAKPLDDGKTGHEFGCFIGAVFFPERGACLEKRWNMERYKETLKTPPKPKTVSPKRAISRGGGESGGVTRGNRAGRGSYNLGSGYSSGSPSTGNSAGYGNFTFSGGGGSGLRPAPMLQLK